MALEGGFSAAKSFEVSEKALAKTDASDKKQKLISNEEIRLQTVEKLWSITEDLNILYKENWTRLATQEVLKFQESLVRTFKNYGSSVSVRTGSLKEETAVYYTHHQHRWSFASSFLYSLTVITTIGKSNKIIGYPSRLCSLLFGGSLPYKRGKFEWCNDTRKDKWKWIPPRPHSQNLCLPLVSSG